MKSMAWFLPSSCWLKLCLSCSALLSLGEGDIGMLQEGLLGI